MGSRALRKYESGAVVRMTLPLPLATLLASACDPGLPRNLVAVTGDQASGIVGVLYARCPNELITSVEIVVLTGNVVGDENDQVLWEITSANGSTNSAFVVGRTPVGFVEQVPLESPLPSDKILAAIVDTNLRPQPYEQFSLEQLRADKALTDDAYVDPREFVGQTLQDCPG